MKKLFSLTASFLLVLIFSGCNQTSNVKAVAVTPLFSLDYGKFEDQLDFFDSTNEENVQTSVVMRDGFFYVVNGEAGKIMTLNSYGDLLSLNYEEDLWSSKNSSLPSVSTEGIWKPVEYPFNYNGKIAIDSRKYMYAVGQVPRERNEQNEKENLLYSQVILCFSSDGTVIDYIGQEGPGGTPFPFIKEIYTTENNELVVVCVTTEGLCAYWFGINRFLKFKVPVLVKNIPRISLESINPQASQSDLFVSLENVVPDSFSQRLYIKADYYLPHIDQESKVQSGVDYIQTLIYPLNIENGFFGEPVIVPPYEESVTEDFSKLTYKLPYDFLGIGKNGWFYFIISTEKGFDIELLQPGTQNIIKRRLDVDHKNTLYYSLSLSYEGIISALLCNRDKADVVWWRTDGLIDNLIRN